MPKLTYPTIHWNGTAKESLIQDLAVARSSVAVARSSVIESMRLLQATEPHNRDYYPQGPGAFAEAQAQHVARLLKLAAVRDELLDIMEHIDLSVE